MAGIGHILKTGHWHPIREEIRLIEALVRHAGDWQRARHTWWHPARVTIWTGNLDIGISIKWDTKDAFDYHSLQDATTWRLNPREYRFLRKAIESARCGEAVDRSKEIKEFAFRVWQMHS